MCYKGYQLAGRSLFKAKRRVFPNHRTSPFFLPGN
nr:MAG TPA: hypothetical protein [Caudoviricetes sp.]